MRDAIDRVTSLLHTLFETADDGILLLDGMFFVDCNPATLRMFGCSSKDEIVGKTPFDFSPERQPDGEPSAEKARRLVWAALNGVTQQFEWRHSRLDRTEFDAEIKLNHCMLAGTPFLIALTRDITARKRAEAALRRTVLADEMINGILARCASSTSQEYDADMNAALRELAGFVEADHAYFFLASPDRSTYSCTHETTGPSVPPLGKKYTNVSVGDDAWIEPTLLGGETVNIELTSDHPASGADPGCRALLHVPTSGTSGEFKGALGVDSHSRKTSFSDHDVMLCRIVGNALTSMTERKRMADRVLQEKQFSDCIIDCLPGIFYVYDSTLHLRRWNKNFEEIIGCAAEEMYGRPLGHWLSSAKERARVTAMARRVLEGDDMMRFVELDLSRPSGAAISYLVSGAAVDSPEGRMLVGVGIDITERKRNALERERLMAELAAANSAKDQFLAVLSHELRTPLAAIQAGIESLRRFVPEDDPRASRAAEVIERNVELQARLVSDLLDLSRLVRGHLTLERAPTRLDDVVLSAVEACRADAARAEVALEAHAEPGLWVDVDGNRIRQLVINLVGNGLKFTPKGGRVNVSVVAKAERAEIIVEDTGMGIEEGRLPELFQMFRQGQIAARRAPGLGIGLALVKSIVELHGGRVRAESGGAGRGSRFTVDLPLCEAPKARERPEATPPPRKLLKMLLVEDNSDLRAMLADTFSSLQYRVLAAESGEEALEILSREAVDVILADIGLPGMDGNEFLRRARRLPSAARCTAFALTGYGRENDVRLSRDAGFVDHFVKPCDTEAIDRRIRARLAELRG